MSEKVEKEYVFTEDSFKLAQENERLIDKAYKTTTYWQDAWHAFSKNKGALIGAIVILIIIFMAVFGPYFNEHTYKSLVTAHSSLTPRIPGLEKLGIFNGTWRGQDVYAKKGVSDLYYWFGTDTLGRDLFTRVWTGTRISLIIAVVAVVIDICIGMTYGLVSGFFGGKVDMVMQRIAEIINSIPTLVVVTLLGLILPQGIGAIIFALMITGWVGMARIARAQVLKLKESEYILASRTLGCSNLSIIFKDILPNITGQIIVQSMFSIPAAIFTEAYLSMVGLGLPAPLASLGVLISDGYKSMTIYPHMLLTPIIVLSLLMVCFNLFADGLRDAFDPKSKAM